MAVGATKKSVTPIDIGKDPRNYGLSDCCYTISEEDRLAIRSIFGNLSEDLVERIHVLRCSLTRDSYFRENAEKFIGQIRDHLLSILGPLAELIMEQ